MSVIAVKGIPQKWSLMNVVKILAKSINGHFEALNFQASGKMRASKVKVCYLRLSEKLDPVRVVERINSGVFPKIFRPFAHIPDHVPDLPLASNTKKITPKMQRQLRLPEDHSPDKVLNLTCEEVLSELQLKYPGLYALSKKTGHKLLEQMAKKIMQRLQTIADRNSEVLGSCFKLSQAYRRAHPHFGDFQLVLGELHALQDADAVPRSQLNEKELAKLPPHTMSDYLPQDKMQAACNKYSDRIINKISEHVKNLKSEFLDTDTEDEIVRKKVREELKKMAPYLPLIVKQVVAKHFVSQKTPYYRVRIYGEPFLPSKETMSPFLRRYHPVRVMRSERMFNLLRFNVPPAHFASLIAMDGTVLNGAKLVIRSSDMPIHKVSASVLAGIGPEPEPESAEMETVDDYDYEAM